jgi:biotin synthase-like enzyme
MLMIAGIDGCLWSLVGMGIKEEDLLLFRMDENMVDEVGVASLYPTEERK